MSEPLHLQETYKGKAIGSANAPEVHPFKDVIQQNWALTQKVYQKGSEESLPCYIAGKTILITGASRGLGAVMVDSFAKAHAGAIVLTGRPEAPLNDAKLRLEREYPGTKFIASVDVAGVPESVTTMFELLKGQVQQIDVLISNAGILSEYGHKVGETDGNKFWDDMVCRFFSNFPSYSSLFTAAVNAGLINFTAADHPMTFIALTMMVTEPYPNMTGYALSKLLLIKLVEILDLEYPNIRSYAIMPGVNETDMFLDVFKPLGLDKPSLAGGLIVYLCSPKADFLSGRYLDARWDTEQFEERKEEIVKNDWLKLQISGY